MIPHEKCNKSYSKHFFVKCTVFCMKGVKGFKKCDFAGDVKFLFFIRFWWGFLHLIPLNESFQWYVNRFSLSFTVFELKGVKGVGEGQYSISYNMEKFNFSHDFHGVFTKWFLMKNAKKFLKAFFGKIYSFLYKRGQRVKKMWFCRR